MGDVKGESGERIILWVESEPAPDGTYGIYEVGANLGEHGIHWVRVWYGSHLHYEVNAKHVCAIRYATPTTSTLPDDEVGK